MQLLDIGITVRTVNSTVNVNGEGKIIHDIAGENKKMFSVTAKCFEVRMWVVVSTPEGSHWLDKIGIEISIINMKLMKHSILFES